jgi:hypothetical protein
MRERVEDLGRIAVMIEGILDEEIFEIYSGRAKDFYEWFSSENSDRKADILYKIGYGLRNLSEKLHEVQAIAFGLDDMNDRGL